MSRVGRETKEGVGREGEMERVNEKKDRSKRKRERGNYCESGSQSDQLFLCHSNSSKSHAGRLSTHNGSLLHNTHTWHLKVRLYITASILGGCLGAGDKAWHINLIQCILMSSCSCSMKRIQAQNDS